MIYLTIRSSVSIVTRLQAGIFISATASRAALGPFQPSIQWAPPALPQEIKWPWREADHFHLVQRLRMLGAIPALPPYVFMASCLVQHRENVTLMFIYSRFKSVVGNVNQNSHTLPLHLFHLLHINHISSCLKQVHNL
jgi:hypothetical protein